MSDELDKLINIDKDTNDDNCVKYNGENIAKPEVTKVIFNRNKQYKEKALDISDIQDEEDIYNRIEIRQLQVRLKSKGSSKTKRKRKLIQYDYGEEDANDNTDLSMAQLPRLNGDMRHINSNVEIGDNIVSGESNVGSIEDKRQKCRVILENFENLNLIEQFCNERNLLLQLHLFHLYIYSIVYNQVDAFLKANNNRFAEDYFVSVLSTLLDVNELNYNFNEKFMPETKPENNHQNNRVPREEAKKGRTVEAIKIPCIILKRLDIQEDQ